MKSKKLSEIIIKTFKSNGFVLSEPEVLLDSEYIIQRSGEKFRSSMLTFEREDGKTMCLRPDLTVASCISFLQNKSKSKIYYSGEAYRRSSGKGANFINDQLGIEILGSKNLIKDYEYILATARLLPNYGFPVGLNVVDKFAKITNWMSKASRKYYATHLLKQAIRSKDHNTISLAVKILSKKVRSWRNRPLGGLAR